MKDDAALRTALTLFSLPVQARALRNAPLPEGMVRIFTILAGENEILAAAARELDRSEKIVLDACQFYVTQVLLHPQADSYRMLGADAATPTPQLRANMALLMRWLHPDHDPKGERKFLANRVLSAWENVKNAERRAAYDARLATVPAAKPHRFAVSRPVMHPLVTPGASSGWRRLVCRLLLRQPRP